MSLSKSTRIAVDDHRRRPNKWCGLAVAGRKTARVLGSSAYMTSGFC